MAVERATEAEVKMNEFSSQRTRSPPRQASRSVESVTSLGIPYGFEMYSSAVLKLLTSMK